MEIYPVSYSKDLLDKAPEDERNFHLMAGQLANDINILTTLLTVSLNPTPETVTQRANTAIAWLLIKVLAGRLNEGWLTIKDQFLPLYKRYENDLGDDAKQKLKEIKTYFSKDNLIKDVRNKCSFHSDGDLMKTGYNVFPEGETFVDYLSEYRGHCFYYSSEIVSVIAMTKLLDGEDWKQSVDKIAGEITRVTLLFGDFITYFMYAFVSKYIADAVPDITENKITLEQSPPIDTVHIPFFCAPPLKRSSET